MIIEGEDYYIEKGNWVFTEKYHLKRGYCCGSGCRHCPYNYEKVEEKKREQLLRERDGEEDLKMGMED